MVLAFFRSHDHSPIEEVEAILVGMLQDAAIVYDTATDAVFGAGKSKEARKKVRRTDKRINRGQEEVRQKLVVHGAVRGAEIDLPIVLAYMSVVKDVERVGDYAKNLYDLAKYGADLTEGADTDTLAKHREYVGDLIVEASEIFESNDLEAAQAFCDKADVFADLCDTAVRAAHGSGGKASDAVARALFYRYMKRITAHLLNLVSSMIVPLGQLDSLDEKPEDR